jgi:mannose-6-phosphate isomerase-like protein (cupin superfamily)
MFASVTKGLHLCSSDRRFNQVCQEYLMGEITREELKGRVLKLADLVVYQESTVASRMIINNKAGSITIFSFDKNEGLSEHSAPFDAVLTVLEGECEVKIGGIPHQLKEGETIASAPAFFYLLPSPLNRGCI